MKFHKGVEFRLSGTKNRLLQFEGLFQQAALLGTLIAGGLWIYFLYHPDKPAVLNPVFAAFGFLFILNLIFLFSAKTLRDQWIKLDKCASTDSVTGIMNRECFEEMLQGELRRAGRYRYPLSICLLDLDDFASFNTHFGRGRADQRLREFAEFVNSNIRFVDCAARFERDEFMIYLPHTDIIHAQKFVTRLLIQTEERLDCGFSAGVTAFQPGEKRVDLMIRIQAALNEAKRSGKKQIHSVAPGKESQAVVRF